MMQILLNSLVVNKSDKYYDKRLFLHYFRPHMFPRRLDGRVLVDISKQLDKQIANLRAYFMNQAESSIMYRAIIQAGDKPEATESAQLSQNR